MAKKKKQRKQTSSPQKRRAASLNMEDRFVRRAAPRSQKSSRSSAARPNTNVFARVMAVYMELPSRLARCTTPVEFWGEQMQAGQRLLAALRLPVQ
jgi:hypothetical protein